MADSSSSEEPCPPVKASSAKLVRLKSSPATAAARTTRGNGTERKYRATKASTAKPTSTLWLMVRLPILRTASTTIAITTGWIPYKRPVIAGTSEWATARYERSHSTKMEGITKNEPATMPPTVPCNLQPM